MLFYLPMPSPRERFLPYAAVALLAVALYLPTLGFGFVFDDEHLIVNNTFLRQPGSPFLAFAHHFWYGTPFATGYYRPMVTASLALGGLLLGWGPAGFHLINILLHAANAALVMALARRLGVPGWAAAIAATLFAVHPAAAWPVASIVARVDLLPACFLLLAWLALSKPRAAGSPLGSAVLTGMFFLLALLSKESAVAFLAVPALGLRRPERATRRDWLPVATTLGALAIYLAARLASGVGLLIGRELIDPLTNPLAQLPGWPRQIAALGLCGRYLLYLLVPVRFSDPGDYGLKTAGAGAAPGPWPWFGLALLAAWALGTLALWRRRDRLSVPLAFALGSFLPASNLLLPIGSLYAQNFLYLPLLGLSLAIGEALGRLAPNRAEPAGAGLRADRPPPPTPGWASQASRAAWVAWPILGILAIGSWRETAIWRDGVALFSTWSERFPHYALARSRLGVALLARGDAPEAIAPLRKALEMAPRNSEAEYNLGVALALTASDRAGWEEALRHTRLAIELLPDFPQARVNAARLLILLEQPAEAEVEAREALRLGPDLVPARINLAESLFRQARFAEAASAFEDLATQFPADPEILSPYIVSLIHAGDLVRARRAADAARRALPSLAWFDFCLARIEAREGHRDAARALLRQALDKDPAVREWMGKVEELKDEPL